MTKTVKSQYKGIAQAMIIYDSDGLKRRLF